MFRWGISDSLSELMIISSSSAFSCSFQGSNQLYPSPPSNLFFFFCKKQLHVLLFYIHKCLLRSSSQLHPSTHIHCPSSTCPNHLSLALSSKHQKCCICLQLFLCLDVGVEWNVINCNFETFIGDLCSMQQSRCKPSLYFFLFGFNGAHSRSDVQILCHGS